MAEYHVSWEIDVVAENREDAALTALSFLQAPTSATVFVVAEDGQDEAQVDLGIIDRVPTPDEMTVWRSSHDSSLARNRQSLWMRQP